MFYYKVDLHTQTGRADRSPEFKRGWSNNKNGED